MVVEDLEQLTQKIKDQLEESITQNVTQQLMMSFSHMQSQMQSQGFALPLEIEVGPSAAHVSTKEISVDPPGQDLKMGDSDKFGLYVDDSPPRLVAFGSVYEESTTFHNVPLGNDQVKVGVEEVRDADVRILVPT